MPRSTSARRVTEATTMKVRSRAKGASATKRDARQIECPPDDSGKSETAQGQRTRRSTHHSVYVVFLRNPCGDGKAGYYVGMTGLTPEARFENHKRGYKGAGVVRRCGERLVPKLYEHLNPMTYEDAVVMERQLAHELKAKGYQVFGGH